MISNSNSFENDILQEKYLNKRFSPMKRFHRKHKYQSHPQQISEPSISIAAEQKTVKLKRKSINLHFLMKLTIKINWILNLKAIQIILSFFNVILLVISPYYLIDSTNTQFFLAIFFILTKKIGFS